MKPIQFEKGKYYIRTEKIDAYYDVNEGKFFSAKTNKPYKGVVSGFASLVTQCEDDSFYDNRKFQFSPKELAFIMTCSNCHPISIMTTEKTKQQIASKEKILSMLTLPQDAVFDGAEVIRTISALESLEDTTKIAALWAEYSKQEKSISPVKLLSDFRDWVYNYIRENDENRCRTLMAKYTQNEETIATFIPVYKNKTFSIIFEETNFRRAVYYYERGLRDYYKDIDSNWQNHIFAQLRHFFQMCAEMNIRPPKENWFIARCQVLKDYVSWKNKELNERLAAAQEPKKEWLSFEDDNFIVIVPITSDEFVQEANAQNNCVNSWYKERVANKETHVVFVRKKSNPSKSYITCEVSNDGYIRQFLLVNNKQCDGAPEVNFCRAYQNHLRNMWNA